MKQQAGLTDQEIEQILDGIDEIRLNEWERTFLASIRGWWKKSRKLSEKQSKRLAELWKKQHEVK